MAKLSCIYGAEIAHSCPVRNEYPNISLAELTSACNTCPLKHLYLHNEIAKRTQEFLQRNPSPQPYAAQWQGR